MDDLNEKILAILRDNGRASYTDIGKKTSLSEGAVRKRIRALLDSGAISKFTVQLGNSTGTRAVVLLSLDSQAPTSAVSQSLMNIPGVQSVFEVTGQFDIAAIVTAPSIVDVNQSIEQMRTVEGVATTNTLIVLRQW